MVNNPPDTADGEGNLDKVNLAEVPLSLDVLADLHAGVYDARDAEILRQRAEQDPDCLLYTSPSPRDLSTSRMPSSA